MHEMKKGKEKQRRGITRDDSKENRRSSTPNRVQNQYFFARARRSPYNAGSDIRRESTGESIRKKYGSGSKSQIDGIRNTPSSWLNPKFSVSKYLGLS